MESSERILRQCDVQGGLAHALSLGRWATTQREHSTRPQARPPGGPSRPQAAASSGSGRSVRRESVGSMATQGGLKERLIGFVAITIDFSQGFNFVPPVDLDVANRDLFQSKITYVGLDVVFDVSKINIQGAFLNSVAKVVVDHSSSHSETVLSVGKLWTGGWNFCLASFARSFL